MVEAHILYDQLCDAESETDTEHTLVRLIHALLEDDNDVSYQIVNGVEYDQNWVDAGRFNIDAYTVSRARDYSSWRINMAASYDDYLIDAQDDADFHANVEGHIVLQITAQCGPKAFTGDATVFAFPETNGGRKC